MNVNIHAPHIRLNQTNERICLAWSGRHGAETLQTLQEETERFVRERNMSFIPRIIYACPLHTTAQANLGIQVPGIAIPVNVGKQNNQPAED